MFGSPPAVGAAWLVELSEMLGFALLAAATLWRIWCALFIAGSQERRAARPLAPTRWCATRSTSATSLGVVGFGFAVRAAAPRAAPRRWSSPCSIRRWWRRRKPTCCSIFGERYAAYCAAVPRWIPDWSLYQEPAAVTVSPRRMRGAILDAMWFLWAFALWEFIEELHSLKLLPTLF